MKCVIYARVSSKEQDREGFSIPSQLKLLREYALKNGFEIEKEFTDSESAKSAGRQAFNEMLTLLRSKKDVRTLLVEKTDRLYRNFPDYVRLEELDVIVHLVKEGETISKDSMSHAKFIHGIKLLMAKNYIDNLSEEVKKGFLEKAEQGLWPHRAPVGYSNDTNSHTIFPDPIKSEIIHELFVRYSTGNYSLQSLSDIAKQSGLFSRNSQVVNKAGIHRILKNSIYCGEFNWKGKRYIGKHEQIVSKSLFDDVQRLLSAGRPNGQVRRQFPFTGLVKCGLCGCSMTAEIKKGKYIYYRCTQFKGKCGNTYIRQEKLDDLFAEIVGRVKVHPSVVDDIRMALLESQKDRAAFQTKSLEALSKREKHLQKLIDTAYEDKLLGVISIDLWKRKSEDWQSELVDISHKIREFKGANVDYYQTGVGILELANTAYGKYLKQEYSEKRRLLQSLLSNSTFTRGSLCPTYKQPFDILAKGLEFQSKRGRRDSNSRPPA